MAFSAFPTAEVFIFDAYGTLLDVNAAASAHGPRVGENWLAFADLWRTKQLEYSWVLSLMGQYKDFWSLTEAALDYALEAFDLEDPSLRADLLDSYRSLQAYEEVPGVLQALREAGKPAAILSNGTPDMLATATRAAKIDGLLTEILTVAPVQIFKTAPQVYALVEARFQVRPGQVAFFSSNAWDAAGAAAYGFDVTWVNRAGKPAEYPFKPCLPNRVVRSLREAFA